MTIYFDNCCYNRITDDRHVARNYLEREAILVIFELIYRKQHDIHLIASDILSYEMSKNQDAFRRKIAYVLMSNFAEKMIFMDHAVYARALEIREMSKIRLLDSLHLALAEKYTDALITTDRLLINQSNRLSTDIRVLNPIQFVQEVLQDDANY